MHAKMYAENFKNVWSLRFCQTPPLHTASHPCVVIFVVDNGHLIVQALSPTLVKTKAENLLSETRFYFWTSRSKIVFERVKLFGYFITNFLTHAANPALLFYLTNSKEPNVAPRYFYNQLAL